MNLKRSKIVVYVILLLTGFLLYKLYTELSCRDLSCLKFPNKSQWKIADVYEGNRNTWHGMVSAPDYLIRIYKIGNVSESAAQELTKVTLMTTKGLFDTARNPYVGQISDKIVCPENLIPKEKDIESVMGITIHLTSTYLNSRFQYGACTETQLNHKVLSGIFYCKNVSEWYQIEVIVPTISESSMDKYEELFKEAGCQRPSINTGKLSP